MFVWFGGAMFVGALSYCAWSYLVTWAGAARPGVFAGWSAVAFDAAAFTVFALHHSVLARESVKEKVAQLVPAHLVRSVYVWIASALLILVCALWQPAGGDLFRHAAALAIVHAAVQLAGLALIALSVRAIDPLELAGIRESKAIAPSTLQITGPYHLVRHPLYLGWMLAVFGAAHMTADRLAFAAISSIYLLMAVPWEEKSLRRTFGKDYETYAMRVRWRVIPFVY